jgi:hypothetical protein
VCVSWRYSYRLFALWALVSGYEDGLTIERNDVNGNYEPTNCKWIPGNEQGRNTRRSVRVVAFGETKLLLDWVDDERCAAEYDTVYARLQYGWRSEEAIATPPVKGLAVTAWGETKYLRDWSRHERCAVGYGTLRARLQKYGWTPEEAIGLPCGAKGRVPKTELVLGAL